MWRSIRVPDRIPDSSDPLPPEFFMNPRCPLTRAPTEATVTEAEQSETVEKENEPKMRALAEDLAGIS